FVPPLLDKHERQAERVHALGREHPRFGRASIPIHDTLPKCARVLPASLRTQSRHLVSNFLRFFAECHRASAARSRARVTTGHGEAIRSARRRCSWIDPARFTRELVDTLRSVL